MQRIILGFALIIVVLISGCVDLVPEQVQETEQVQKAERVQETEQVPPDEISYTGVDIKNLTGSTPVILSIKPNAGTVGTKIVITGRGFTAEYNNIAFRLQPENSRKEFKVGYETSIKSSDGEIIEFKLPSDLGACAHLPNEGTICKMIALILSPETTYPLFIVNSNGTSNSVNFTVK